MDPTTPSPAAISFIPLFVMMIVALVLSIYLINKKGKSMWLLLLAVVPLLNSFLIVYLLSQTNKDVLDEIKALKDQLEKLGQRTS